MLSDHSLTLSRKTRFGTGLLLAKKPSNSSSKNSYLNQSLPDNSKPFSITTNTSKHASGGILLQADSNGNWHPCSYLFQSFSPTKRIYDVYDRELLAIIQGLKTCTTTCMDPHSQYKYSPTSCILRNPENSTDDKHNG